MKDKNNLEPSDYISWVSNNLGTVIRGENKYDTLYICAKRTILKDTELGFEIDLKNLKQFNKIVIDGITFVKETKDVK